MAPDLQALIAEATVWARNPPFSEPSWGVDNGTIPSMNEDEAKLLEAALKLPPEARAAFAGSLLDSLDETLDRDAEAAWEAEIAKRVKELDSSSVKPIPWSEARRAIIGD